MNVYDNPGHFGVTIIGSIEWDDWCYSFDMTLVVRDAQGKLYWGDDEGCSCPSPFEDFTTLDDLTTGTPGELDRYLDERLVTAESSSAAADVADLKLRIREHR